MVNEVFEPFGEDVGVNPPRLVTCYDRSDTAPSRISAAVFCQRNISEGDTCMPVGCDVM
jgi:hypothetical protein